MPVPYRDVRMSGEIDAWVRNRAITGESCMLTRAEAWKDFRDFMQGEDDTKPLLVSMRHFHKYLREEIGWPEGYFMSRPAYVGVALSDTFSEARCLSAKEKRKSLGLVDRIVSLIITHGDFSESSEISAKDLCQDFLNAYGADLETGENFSESNSADYRNRRVRLTAFGQAIAQVAEEVGIEKHRYSDGIYYRNIRFPKL